MSQIDHLQTATLELPPSCVEFDPSNPQYAVIGTYNLEKQGADETSENGEPKKSQERNGSLILIRVEDNTVTLLQTLPTPSAILDVHFTPAPATPSRFGVATSTGSIGLYGLVINEHSKPTISHITTIQFFPEDVLITAFSWHPDNSTLGMTLSSGQVCLGRSSQISSKTSSLSPADVMAHDLEAWTLAFVPDGSGMLSGGDDGALRFTELPQDPVDFYEELNPSPKYAPWKKTPWADKKIHGAGVTAILPIDWDDASMLVITGSYDDHIRLLYIPSVGRRQILTEMNLGGGVWRLKMLDAKRASRETPKWHPDASSGRPEELLLLVSCMHAGARIVKLSCKDETWEFEVLAKFEEHKSMNYGSDCQPQVDGDGKRTFVTTSFYDKLLCLWKF